MIVMIAIVELKDRLAAIKLAARRNMAQRIWPLSSFIYAACRPYLMQADGPLGRRFATPHHARRTQKLRCCAGIARLSTIRSHSGALTSAIEAGDANQLMLR